MITETSDKEPSGDTAKVVRHQSRCAQREKKSWCLTALAQDAKTFNNLDAAGHFDNFERRDRFKNVLLFCK